jgi:hypothetical protein
MIFRNHDTKVSMDTFVSLFRSMASGVMAPRAESESFPPSQTPQRHAYGKP